MRIVVTGGLGRAGRLIVRELVSGTHGREAHKVLVFDRMPHAAERNIRYLAGDVLDLGQVVGALAGYDAVLHLAGVPKNGIVTDEVTVRTNVMGTFNVHEAAALLGIKRIVTLSSEAVLGWTSSSPWMHSVPPEYFPIDEKHPVRPRDAYGASKLAAEAVIRSISDRVELTTVVMRPPHIVVPDELAALRESKGRTPSKFSLFHYIDVRDLAEVCRRALERPLSGCHILYVGSGESTVSEPLCTLLPRLMPAIGDKAAALTEGRAAVSVEQAKKLFDWTPKYSWRSGPL
jgi:nucleoside-diphosphate-sugar epimerase